jgi:cytochrome P450
MKSSSPPGPKGMPVVGSTPTFLRQQLRFLTSCRDAYGDLASFDLGPDTAYVATHPDHVKRVLVSEADKYRKPDFSGALGDVIGNGLLLHEGGDGWWERRQRSQPAYSMRKFLEEQQVEAARTCTADLMERWEDGQSVRIQEEMIRIALRIVADSLFDIQFSERTVEAVARQLEPLGAEFEPDIARAVLPEWVPTPPDRGFQRSHANLRSFMDEIVRERRPELAGNSTTDSSAGAGAPNDVLSIMIRASENNEIDTELLRQELLTVLLAGTDTTALALNYTWYLLSQNPEAESKLHDEIESVLGGSPPTGEDLRDLKYTEHVLSESMRLYPPVYLTVREARKPVELDGYRIPTGSIVMLPQWVIHRDQRWYDEPEKFDPDRWTRERTSNRPKHSYFPFGAGPRQCIGKPVARPEMKLVIATIAQNYRLQNPQPKSLEFEPAVTLQPAERITMTAQKR